VAPLTLAADGQHIYFHDGEKVICLNRKNGDEVWSSEPVARRSPIPTCFGPTLVVYQDVVLFSGGNRSMTALSAQTGKTLWTSKHPRSGHQSPEDLLVVDGLVWAGAIAGGRDSGVFTGRDPHTGEVKNQLPPDVKTYWFHHRCYRSKATDRYLLPSRTGIEFIDFRKKQWTTHHWVRGGCIYGIMPCNGLIYAPPHSCACYIESKLNGFNALAPARESKSTRSVGQHSRRLEKGAAYNEIGNRQPAIGPGPITTVCKYRRKTAAVSCSNSITASVSCSSKQATPPPLPASGIAAAADLKAPMADSTSIVCGKVSKKLRNCRASQDSPAPGKTKQTIPPPRGTGIRVSSRTISC